MTQLPRRGSGFTLIELAMVLFIVSLLIGGLLMPLAAQNEIRGRQETERALSNIRDALIGFAVINGRLPCPADRTIASGAANAGMEATAGTGATLTCACASVGSPVAKVGMPACTSNSVTGVLPWATLGLPETDAWDQRFDYRVDAVFSRGVISAPILTTSWGTGCALTQVSDMPTRSAFALCTQGDMSVKTVAGGSDIATSVPAIVLSHGKNTLGAYLKTGTGQIGGAAGDELENANDDAIFVSSSNIDDQLIWLPTSILMGRMLSAGRLP
jgi:prepilin-type N-terminal cleavage/methylation domain-containing protein